MNSHIVCIGRHEGLLRDVARGCAYGNPLYLKTGAKLLSAFIKDGATLVPMPSHVGYATTMLSLCRWIKANGVRLNICDCLECDPHESSHIVKLRNGCPPDVMMYPRHKVPEHANVYIIDNTVATGATAVAALSVIPQATVLAITKG